jgi:hypothetical protein
MYEARYGEETLEVPIAMVALVATAVSNFLWSFYCAHSPCQLYAALYKWCHGEHKVTEFSANAYLDMYLGHVNTLKYIQANHEGAFHLMMGDIYVQAK